MMSLSSLFKVKLLNGFLLVGCILLFSGVAMPLWGTILTVVLIILPALSFYHLNKVEREIKRITSTVGALAKGDFEVRLTKITEKGSLGDLQWRLNEMVDAVDAFIREATAAMEHVSRNQYFRRIIETGMQGALLSGAQIINRATQNVEDKMNGFVEVANDLDISLNRVVQQISTTAQDLTQSTDIMQCSVRATRQEVDSAVRDSNETSISVQTISAAAEEMSSCIREITQQMEKTSQVARSAVDESAQARAIINELTQMTDKIGEAVHIIKKISGQTNLLALNATIEAARAGEVGKDSPLLREKSSNWQDKQTRPQKK